MRRRDVLLGAAAATLAMNSRTIFAGQSDVDALKRRQAEFNASALAAFPYKHIVVRGKEALSTWQKLKSGGHGAPVVLGDDDSVVTMMDVFDPYSVRTEKSVSEILTAASRIRFPEDLISWRRADDMAADRDMKKFLSAPDANLPHVYENKDSAGKVVSYTEDWHSPKNAGLASKVLPIFTMPNRRLLSPKETRAFLSRKAPQPAVGIWPKKEAAMNGLAVSLDVMSDKPLPKVHIAIIPTDDWTTIPAYLHWGGWNDCPPPEYHVAALRSWRDRYGAELIGLSHDMMNLRVVQRPKSHNEAITLAREQYVYCRETIEPPKESYSTLAAELMISDWWYFWWE